MRVLLIDNHDSFTFNLYHLLAEVNGIEPTVVRNDAMTLDDLDVDRFDAAVISPGPGRPDRPRDVGLSADVIVGTDLPVLGVCLGHQALCHVLGGTVSHANEAQHGRACRVEHTGEGLFAGIPSPFRAVRYHSLSVRDVPSELEAIAWADDGTVMAVRHRTRPRWGVQFHPESVLTEHGHLLFANLRRLLLAPRSQAGRVPRDPADPAPRGPGGRVPRAPADRAPRGLADGTLQVRRVEGPIDTAAAFSRLFGGSPTSFWLDSAAVVPGRSRFSFLGDASGPLAELITYDVRRHEVTIEDAKGHRVEPGPLLDWLEVAIRRRRVDSPELPFDLDLGYVGYLGYELKAETGGAAAHRSPVPDASLVFADRVVAIDHVERCAYLVALDDGRHGVEVDRWLRTTAEALGALPVGPAGSHLEHPTPRPTPGRGLTVEPRHRPDEYLDLIAACRGAIRDGESYEICLTNELTIRGAFDPLSTYLAYRHRNPAPYAAYLRRPGLAVLSASPERFLRIYRDGTVETRPIKGTAPRSDDPIADGHLAAALQASEKERAENLMIVDLSRHDLGAVCEVGSVEVPELFAVESYPTVHQLVSTVRGRLADGRTAVDAVRAAFPGGSMTGAPKERTMELIDQLEGGPRGAYSGAIGYLACNGAADWSITIRTMVVRDRAISLGVGGAIVALSDPHAELREMSLKGEAAIDTLAEIMTATPLFAPAAPTVPIR